MKASRNTIVVLFLCLAGCASAPPSVYLAPEYRNLRESEVSIVVLPYVQKLMTPEQWQLFIDRKTKEKRLVTSAEVELYEGYFQILLAEKTQARVIPYDKAANPANLRLRTMETGTNVAPKMSLLVPGSGEIQVNGETPEYVFMVEDLFFTKRESDKISVQIPGGRNKSDYYMEAGLDYLIWDNKHERAVACGALTSRTRLLEPPGKEHYLKIMEEFANSIIKNSPFAEKTLTF
jgi:hypothetical protein